MTSRSQPIRWGVVQAAKSGAPIIDFEGMRAFFAALIGDLKRIRDAARADADRAENRGEGEDSRVTPELLRRFGGEARKKIRDREGGFRRHHLQALVQRVEAGADEILFRGSKPRLLQTLVASGGDYGVETAAHGVRSFVPNWLPGPDSNQRPTG